MPQASSLPHRAHCSARLRGEEEAEVAAVRGAEVVLDGERHVREELDLHRVRERRRLRRLSVPRVSSILCKQIDILRSANSRGC